MSVVCASAVQRHVRDSHTLPSVIDDLRQSLGKDVTIKPNAQLHCEQFEVVEV